MGSPGVFELWFRVTTGLVKTDSTGQIAHVHASTPFYMDENRQAALDLQP